jgi:hypothetical protein
MALMLNDIESNKMTKAEQQAMLQQLFTQEQLDLIYDALNEYELVAECEDDNNGDYEMSMLLSSVVDIFVSVE